MLIQLYPDVNEERCIPGVGGCDGLMLLQLHADEDCYLPNVKGAEQSLMHLGFRIYQSIG